MQYSGSTTGQDITTMADKLVKTNSSSFPIEDKTLYANEADKMIWSWIHDAYGGWAYDDNNYDTYPEATTNLVANQLDYTLPSDNLTIKGISIKTSGNVWYPLQAITLEQIQDRGYSESQFLSYASQPTYYRALAKGFKIYSPSNYSQTSSIKLYYDREISGFAITDTTKTPGFDSMYHEAIPTYMAFRYAKINQLANKNDLEKDWLTYEQRIKQDYAKRYSEQFPPRMTVRDYVRENI